MNCQLCGKCCKYIALQLDSPQDREDIENIKWYLVHKNIRIYIDNDLDWYIQIITRCNYLNDNNKCKFYLEGRESERPEICKTHSAETCENSGLESEEKFSFESYDGFVKFLDEYNPFTLEKKY